MWTFRKSTKMIDRLLSMRENEKIGWSLVDARKRRTQRIKTFAPIRIFSGARKYAGPPVNIYSLRGNTTMDANTKRNITHARVRWTTEKEQESNGDDVEH